MITVLHYNTISYFFRLRVLKSNLSYWLDKKFISLKTIQVYKTENKDFKLSLDLIASIFASLITE